MPLAVLSVYSGVSFRKGCTKSGSSNSSSSSGRGSAACSDKKNFSALTKHQAKAKKLLETRVYDARFSLILSFKGNGKMAL